MSNTVGNTSSVLPKSAGSDIIELVERDDEIEVADTPTTVDFTNANERKG